MDYQPLLEGLWAARVAIASLDLAAGSAVLEFTRTASGEIEVHSLRLLRVESLVLIRRSNHDWAYAEASEVGLRERGDALEFGVVLWDEPNEMTIVCHEAWLDGKLIERR